MTHLGRALSIAPPLKVSAIAALVLLLYGYLAYVEFRGKRKDKD